MVLKGGCNLTPGGKAMILLHGRGASAESILPLAMELGIWNDWGILAPQAAHSTWYPYSFLAPREQNQPWLDAALHKIADCLYEIEQHGVRSSNVVLCGFSQGACLASEFAATWPGRLGGLIAFSGGVIGDTVQEDRYLGGAPLHLSDSPAVTDHLQPNVGGAPSERPRSGFPVFLGCSDSDPHIPLQRVIDTDSLFTSLGANVDRRIYPGMGHTVNEDELAAASELLGQI